MWSYSRKNTYGFGIIGISITVLTLVIVAGVGYAVFKHSKHADSASVTTPTKTSDQTSLPTTSNQSKDTLAPQVLQISEWGVKFSYYSNDTYAYVISSNKNSATIGSKNLSADDSSCATRGAGVIERFVGSDSASPYGGDPTVAEDAQQHPGTYMKVGDYYYLFVHSQASCDSVSSDDQNKANEEVKAAVSQLQAASSTSSN